MQRLTNRCTFCLQTHAVSSEQEAVPSKRHCSESVCLWTYGRSNIHTIWLQRKPKIQGPRSSAICFFSHLSPPHTYMLVAAVCGVSLRPAKWKRCPPGEALPIPHVASAPWRMKSTPYRTVISELKREQHPPYSRTLGAQGVRPPPRLLDLQEIREDRTALGLTQAHTGQARSPKSCFPWGPKGGEVAIFQKCPETQMCLYLGRVQDHFCSLQPHLQACTFQVMKSATHFE